MGEDRTKKCLLSCLKRVSMLLLVIIMIFRITDAKAANYRYYDIDSDPEVLINWQTFVDNDFPDSWESLVIDAVINAYTRWNMVAGARVRPKFQGITTRTDPEVGEIIVQANEKHYTSTRLASAFGSGYGKVKIVIHRKSGATNTNWNWVPYWAQSGEYDMQAVITHELGHAFGIWDHTSGSRDTMNGGYEWHRQRFGPNSNDVATLRDLYGVRSSDDFYILRSTDQGSTWNDFSTNLTSLNLSSNMDPAALRDYDRSILFYSSPSKKPCWIIGNNTGETFDTGKWWIFGGEKSFYGMGGHGYDDEYMMTWVDNTSDDMVIKVVRSTNGGENWHWRNPPLNSTTIGTPAIRKVVDNTWILAYAKLDLSDRTKTGRVMARVSTNDGVTWGSEIDLNDFYRAMSGVNIANNGTGEILIGFSWAARSTTSNQRIRTIRTSLSGDTLDYQGMMYGIWTTRTQPVLGATMSQYLLAYREQNYMTTIDTLGAEFGTTSWTNFVSLPDDTTLHTTPAMAAFFGLSWAFIYYLQD